MKRVFTATVALVVALVAAPAAQAATHDYGPGETSWTGETESQGLCVPALLCPLITNSVEEGVGAPGTNAGFLETRLGALTGVGATSIGIFTSSPFEYKGVAGKAATSLRFGMSRQADVGQLLAVAGNTATYSVDLVANDGSVATNIVEPTTLAGAPAWLAIPKVPIEDSAMRIGRTYRLRITTRYDTGATVIPGGSADYDAAQIRARRQTNGNGNGGGADTQAGLARSGVNGNATISRNGKRIRVKVRCSPKLEGACKMTLIGLVTRHGPKLTHSRHVRVGSGKKKVVSLRVRRKGYLALVERGATNRIFVRQQIRADKTTKQSVVRLKLKG